MHTGKQKQMNASYQASLVNRHIRRFTGLLLRARPKAERVFAEYENFLKLSDPTDRPTDRPWRFSASYIFWTKLPIGKRFSATESHIQ